MDEGLEFLTVEKQILEIKLEDVISENEFLKEKCSNLELKLCLAAKDFSDDEVSSLRSSLIDVMRMMLEIQQSDRMIEMRFKDLNDENAHMRTHYRELLMQKKQWDSKIEVLSNKVSTLDDVYAELAAANKLNEEMMRRNEQLESLVQDLRVDIRGLEQIITIGNEMERIRTKNEEDLCTEIKTLKERASTLETSLNGASETVDSYFTSLSALRNRLETEQNDESLLPFVHEIEGIINCGDSYVNKLENKKRIAHFNRIQKYKATIQKVKDADIYEQAATEIRASRPFLSDDFIEHCENGVKVFNTIKRLLSLSNAFVDSLVDRKNNLLDCSNIAAEPHSSIRLFLYLSSYTVYLLEFSEQASIYKSLLHASDVCTLKKVGNQLSSVRKIETVLNNIIDLFLSDRLDPALGTDRITQLCKDLQALRRLHFPDLTVDLNERLARTMKGLLNISQSFNDAIKSVDFIKLKASLESELFEKLEQCEASFTSGLAKLKRCVRFSGSECMNVHPTNKVNEKMEELLSYYRNSFFSLKECIYGLLASIEETEEHEELKEKFDNIMVGEMTFEDFLNGFAQGLTEIDALASRFGDGEFDFVETENICRETIFNSLESFAKESILKRKESNESAITSLLQANEKIKLLNSSLADMGDQVEGVNVKYSMLNKRYTDAVAEFCRKEEQYKQSITTLQDKTANEKSQMGSTGTPTLENEDASLQSSKLFTIGCRDSGLDNDTFNYYVSSIKRLTKENSRILGAKLNEDIKMIERDFADRRSRNVLQGFKVPQKKLLELTREVHASACNKRIFDLTKSEEERKHFLVENYALNNIDNLNKLSKLKSELDVLRKDHEYADFAKCLEVEGLTKVGAIIPKNEDTDSKTVAVLVSPDDLRILFSTIL